ncbi:hydantoinase/oxoprolinase family protein [Roseomonas sp. 18066]|uniref:hydantoinase/oxoprolinase family protein n=1 Tax=Roseomonas sp. 18066 TaxID=2681412 RepID=UPI001F342692|nr:hydantoinase/oxoprolinase family protein [Roseomonas sp. 18066]
MPDTPTIRLAADIGGTFTDVVLDAGGQRRTRKVLTTPASPEEGVLEGIALVLGDAGLQFSDIDVFVHGTTLATNAIIERRGARTALIATAGFRDILEIGTESRYDQYDLKLEKPKPLVPRSLRFTVPERMDARGVAQLALDETALAGLIAELAAAGVQSVAIAFLHAYANPAHEQRAGALVRAALPGVSVTLASEVCPEVREYERTSTAAANAYVQPLMEGYLGRMAAALQARQYRGATYLVTSGGGLTALETAQKFPVRLVESGPAGGAIFAAQVALRANEQRVLSFDMGGTTAKVCLIEKGEPATSRFFEVDRTARFLKGSGLPLRIPVIEMVEIGAGGGSIAQVDAMQRVTVGPESASSVPGPACYGRGGTRPAVTDADVALGLIEPVGFAGGSMTLEPARALAALDEAVGQKLGLSPEMAAYAVYEMVCENMASAARVHAAERGAVIAQHTMIAFGGAAPLHAARVAEKVGVTRVVVPPNAGVGSAVGFLAAPVAYEIVRSRPARLDGSFDGAAISSLFAEMTAAARALVEPGARGAALFERRIAFMRYVGQGHEITVELPNRALTAEDVAELRAYFEAEYARQFARAIPAAAIEVLNWSVLVSTHAAKPEAAAAVSPSAAPAPSGLRRLFDGKREAHVDVPIYLRDSMLPGARVPGPAIITEMETTTFVSASFDAHIDGSGCIVMEQKAA